MKKVILLLVVLAGFTFGQGVQKTELQAEIVVNAETGWPVRLLVSGFTPQKAWLGYSFYRYNVSDPVAQGDHHHQELPKGAFSLEFPIDNKFLDGSFEFAIWGKKVPKSECTLDYCTWCKKNGFHLDDMKVYKSGYLTRLIGYK
jgi:hypothetical protein